MEENTGKGKRHSTKSILFLLSVSFYFFLVTSVHADTLTLSGTLYESNTTTPYATSTTITIAVATTTTGVYSTTTTVSTGAFSFSVTTGTVATGTPITIFVNGDSAVKAVTVTRTSGTNALTGISLYQNHVIIKNEGGSSTSTRATDLTRYDSTNDSDIQFTASSTLGRLTIPSSQTLYVAASSTFLMDMPTVTGSFETATSGVVAASSTMEVTGNYRNNGTLRTADPTWVSRTAATNNAWQSVTYGNGLFVAVSTSGTGNRVMTSPDGITWTSRTSAANNWWRSVTYGNGLFVAVSDPDGGGTINDRVMTSPDGITWTARTAGAETYWHKVTYGNGLFVAIANNCGTECIMTSPDGITWTAQTTSVDDSWISVTYGNGLFVATAYTAAGNFITSSPNGITWTVRDASFDINDYLGSIVYGNGLFVATASFGVVTSPNGITWASSSINSSINFGDIMYGGGLFVAIAQSGTENRIMTSPDSITWTSRTSAINYTWQSITYGQDIFVAVANEGAVMTSPESYPLSLTGTTTQTLSGTMTGTSTLPSLVFKNGGVKTFTSVASTTDVTIATTSGTVTAPSSLSIGGNIHNGGTLVAPTHLYLNGANQTATGTMTGTSTFNNVYTIGTGKKTFSTNASTTNLTIGTSTEFVAPERFSIAGNYVNSGTSTYRGANWVGRTAAASDSWISVTYGNGLFVAVTNNNVMTSPDGITWTSRTSAAANWWQSVTYGNGLFVAVAYSGTGNRVMTSPDGITWTSRTSAADNDWFSVTYGNGLFVAVSTSGTGNRVMTSPDGITWTSRTSAADNGWQSVTYGNGLFVAVSNDGTGNRVMTSPDGITWTSRTSAADNNWSSVIYGNGLFVAVAGSGTGNRVMTSPDGITWTSRTSAADNNWRSITYGNGLFVTISDTGTGNRVMTSPDGIIWTSRRDAAESVWTSVTYGNGLFVAVAQWITDGGVMTSAPSTLSLSSTTSQALSGTMTGASTLGNLEFSGTSTKTFSNIASTTNITINTGATTVAPTLLSISVNYTNSGIFTHNSGTTTFNGSSAQTATGTMTGTSAFNNLSFTGAGTKTLGTNASSTNFTINTGATVVAPASLSLIGNYTNNGTFTHASGTVLMSSTSAQSLTGTLVGTSAFNNLSFTGAGTKTFSNNASTSDFTISSGSTVVAPASLTIRGVYTNSGTFTHNSGTLYLEGGSVASGTMTGTSALDSVVVNTHRVSNVDTLDMSILKGFVIDDVTGILYAGTDDWAGSFKRCTLTSGCDEVSDFTSFTFPYLDPFDLYAINDLVIDPVDRVLYAGISDSIYGGLVLRCVLSTNCDEATDFTTAYDTTESQISSLTIDTSNGVLYAGSYSGGIIYRCLISTGCDVAGDFTTAYDTTESQISSLTIDTSNGVLYAGSFNGGIIYRCLISTGCDVAGDFTTAYDTTGTEITSIHIDQTQGVLYAGSKSAPAGAIYRCLTSTGCDASGDFTTVFTSSVESINSITFNSTNDILYAVSGSYGGNIYRCVTSTGCDSQNEFMSVENVANSNVYFEEVIVDPSSNRVFVGGYYQFYTFSNSATFIMSASTTNLTIDPGYSLVAPGNLSIAGAYTNSGIFTHNSGTTTFNGSSAQTATGTMTGTSAFNNLSFTGAGTKTLGTNASSTNFTINTGATVVAPASLSLIGNYTNNGTFTHASGTVLMSSTSAQSLTGTLVGTSAFNNLSFTGAGTKTFSNNASTSNFTVDAGATVVAPSILSLSGNFTNNGTFTNNSGTVILSGSATQTATGTMTGTSAFNNLTLANTSANGSTSQSVIFGKQASTTGTFKMLASTSALMSSATSTFTNINLGGVVNQYVWLRSTASGTPWGLNVTGTQEQVSYVNVKDSSACDGSTISASDGTNIDAGGNTCWSFINTTPNLSSGANQIFSLAQATTTISPITLADATTPAITAANDIRIKIATSTITMLWDTTDTTATITGTASGKVSTTVSYEGAGSVLVVAVNSDFASNETITISDLSFTTFGAIRTATSVLSVYTGGAADTTSDDTDDKTIAISGSLTMANHTLGQVSNAFTASTLTAVPLFAFKLTPAGEDVNITSLVFPIRGIEGILQAELTNATLYRDVNGDGNGNGDAGDVVVGGAGVVSISGQTGTITFSTTIVSTSTRDYVLEGNISNVKVLDSINISLAASDMTSVGVTTGLSMGETGSISGFQHIKGGAGVGSNGGAVGGDAPAGQGVTTGGGAGGGGEIDPNSGDTIGNESGFRAPASNGTPQGAWTSGANAYTSDGVYVTTAGVGAQHSYGTFGFSVPTNNTITGIAVKLEASGSTAAGTISVRLSWDNGSSVTSLQTTGTLNTTDGVYTLGGSSDMWGHSWTPTEMNNGNFVIELVANPSSNTVQLDAIQVHVYHQATGGGGGGGGAVWKHGDQYFANVSSAVNGIGNFWADIFNYLLDLFTQESVL